MKTYPIIDVSRWQRSNDEPMGSKAKFWLSDANGELWLFKYMSQGGDDWAEKIAAELAELLTIPHAYVELAALESIWGVISRDFTEKARKGTLVFGNELLLKTDPDYPSGQRFKVGKHTVDRVLNTLNQDLIGLPQPWDRPDAWLQNIFCASDIFVGYLMLDALIGNTDRHHENWGILQKPRANATRQAELAPSFDHAASMGQILSEKEREKRLKTNDLRFTVEAYAQKARSSFYEKETDKRQLSTMEAFVGAAKTRLLAAEYWIEKLCGTGEEDMKQIVYRIPGSRMSDATKEFVIRYLIHNRKILTTMDLS